MTIRKAPAFQFYADDFLSGTMTFSNEQRGLYIALLCLQWSQGSVRLEDARELAGRMAQERMARVLAKFVDDGQGNLKNARLEVERTKQNDFREAKSEAGRAGNAKRWHNHRTTIAQPSHSDGEHVSDTIANGRSPSPSPSPEYRREYASIGVGATAAMTDGMSNHPPDEATVAEHFKRLGADYSAEQIHAAWLDFEATAQDDGRTWMWGKRPVTDWRAAFERRLMAPTNETGKPATAKTVSASVRAIATRSELESLQADLDSLPDGKNRRELQAKLDARWRELEALEAAK